MNSIDIIDLDVLDTERDVTIAFTTLYCADKISNSSLIDLRVWLGLLPAIPENKQKLSVPLSLKIASLRSDSTSPSFLMGTCMIMSEIMRFHPLEEQQEILDNLRKYHGSK